VKDVYNENYKQLKKENEEDCRKWKALPHSWIGSQYCENDYTIRATYMSNIIPIKIPVTFIRDRKITLKFTWNTKKP
jgi:hypothetical protein